MNNHKWILLAEDDAAIAQLTTMSLNADKLGFTILVARDGLEALDCLYHRGAFQTRESGRPAVVLLDLKMPRLDGLEVLRRIKADERLRSVPVVMFTSSRQESDLVRSYHLGANAYVVKPVDFHEFSRALKLVAEFWTTINETLPEDCLEARNQHSQLAAAG